MTIRNRGSQAARGRWALFFLLLVGCGGGSSNGGGSTNHSPTLTAASTATPNAVVGGDVVQLSVGASDPDGDTLSYAWSQVPSTPAGTFGVQAASTTWTAPAVTSGTSFQLNVTVSDGRGGTVSGSATLYLKTAAVPSFAADVEPIFDRGTNPPACTWCHSGAGNPSPRLEPALARAAMVGVPAVDECTSQKLVEPGNPGASVLFARITGTSCGVRMPPTVAAGSVHLGSDYFDTHPGELETIRSWIQAGAPDN